ncbi:uncharacterized protein LOC117336441 [Pecten maximus]|uniref:uncharacterized protein LOC117336441 n=1 Tax=Pecten maximus TaxID=6579 RepID=UPI0014584E4D|nr:uncharacterized protein LOC117336441 [Pecten maximus]
MADQFVGNWICETPYGELEGFDAFNAALGTDPAMVEQYKGIKTSFQYSRNGDVWTSAVTMNGNVMKSYSFSFNQEMEQDGIDGKPYQCLIKIDGDVWVETSVPKDGSNKGITARRTVNGDILTSVTTVNGTNPPVSISIPRKRQ